ncbi:S-adenosyl-l-methionine hydroxide adenosyltransferase family protein [Thioalkalivibrio sp. XN279]|uniref:SAM hydrolase/SAM-dependent halogenase family protein n=1 Tax=Thioalkalivibrio sp. XN279 TaxID=2714953 RepID=UPI0014092515|nr:SAM-dependent chlorinase/fluorinase [Thioalkalivibrio sp. XN279]NHA13596.1 SAM-dependent chlorinase/fluorinase [Thioalkalivibrio sp. XN279]
MPFAPTGLLTLTTDFGTSDPFVGIMKGRILGRLPGAHIVDLTHAIPPGRADLGGFWLAQAWTEFPPGTVHLAVVDPGVGTERKVVLAECHGQLLLAPDNGLLPEALRAGRTPAWRIMRPDLPARLGLGPLSRTFHGRDLFAPLAGLLAAGELEPAGFGPAGLPQDPNPLPRPLSSPGRIRGRVVLADHFGNLITNIAAPLLHGFRQPRVEAGGQSLPLLGTYAEAAPGAPLALVNAFGLVEIAVRGGNAAVGLGLGAGQSVDIRDGIAA